uniref:Uncharacterized protein n=1 Tax=Anguilla anguilla TaxID=7936 RepID=A0A0E9RHZ0_ANGAN
MLANAVLVGLQDLVESITPPGFKQPLRGVSRKFSGRSSERPVGEGSKRKDSVHKTTDAEVGVSAKR